MSIKKEYDVGDTVWIYGIGTSNKITKGRIIFKLDLSHQGYTDLQYVVEIPTHIEPLLELRTWQNISQDEKGPVGSLREVRDNIDANNKKISQLGYFTNREIDEDDPTPEQIMAALEKSTDGLTHGPLNLKEPQQKPKRRYYPKKKK